MFNIRLSDNKVKDLIYVTTFYVLTEIASSFISLFGTYDLKDIIGYLTGGLITFFLLKALDKGEVSAFFFNIKK